jgi:hypothetical protein
LWTFGLDKSTHLSNLSDVGHVIARASLDLINIHEIKALLSSSHKICYSSNNLVCMLTDTHRITSSLDLDDYALLAQKASNAYFPIFCSFLCLPRLRDRPFNLKGFLFRSEFFFRTTQELEYYFLSRGARNLFPEFNIRLYDKNSESDYSPPLSS